MMQKKKKKRKKGKKKKKENFNSAGMHKDHPMKTYSSA